MIEFHLGDYPNEESLQTIENQLSSSDFIQEISVSPNRITIRALDAVSKLSRILNLLDKQDIQVENMSIRGTTLEDVFINLTGRGLRN